MYEMTLMWTGITARFELLILASEKMTLRTGNAMSFCLSVAST